MGNPLHLKHRPSEWDQVLGQDEAVESIQSLVEEGRSKAFLLTGPSGTGKTTIARLIAKMLEAMGSNLIEFDVASRTGVDDARALVESVSFAPLDGGNRVFILDECHQYSKSAWNALLKTIEEPPPGVTWVLCTTEENKVPATIRTRCSRFALSPVDEDQLLDLVEGVVEAEDDEDFPTGDVQQAAVDRAQGSPRQALVNLAAVWHCEDREEALGVLEGMKGEQVAFDLAKVMMRSNASFKDCAKVIAELGSTPGESVRHVVNGYFAKVALNTKGSKAATVERALDILDAFSTPFPAGPALPNLIVACANAVAEPNE